MPVPALTIDPHDGAVSFQGNGAVLVGGMSRAEVLQALEGFALHDAGGASSPDWSPRKGATFGGQPVFFVPLFTDGELTEIHFSVALPGAPLEDGWPTKEAIDAEIAFVRAELQKQLGRPLTTGQAKLAWGEVWSLFDAKGFQANAGLRWNPGWRSSHR